MTTIKKRMLAGAAAVMILAGCFAGCGQKGQNGGSGGNGSANGLDVSLDYSFQSEKAETGELVNTEKFVPMGDKVLVCGNEQGGYAYYLYDPASNSSRKVELSYLKNAPSTAYVESYGIFWDESTNQLNALFGGYDYPVDENGEEATVRLDMTLEVYDADFNLVESRSVADVLPEDVSVSRISYNPGGGSVLAVQNSSTNSTDLYIMDSGFHKTGTIPSPYSWLSSMFVSGNTLYLFGYSEASSNSVVNRLDAASGQLVPAKPDTVPFSAGQCFGSTSEKYDYYCMDSTFIYGVNCANNTCDKVLNFINSDFLSEDISNAFIQLKDGRFLFNAYEDDSYLKSNSWLLTERPADAFKNVTMVTLSALEMESCLNRAVLSFNRTHSDVRIAVTDYSKYMYTNDSSLDYEARRANAIDKMKNDMTSGIIADIICVNSLPYESFCNKGIFEDMTDHFASYSADQYFTNVFDVIRYKGKLYQIAPAFTVETIIGKTEKVGSKEGLTLEELMQLVNNCGPDVKPFGTWTRSSACKYLVGSMISSFTDPESGTCSFNTPEFIKLLEFTASLPESFEDFSFYDDADAYVDDHNLLLETTFEGCRSSYTSLHQSFDDAQTTFIGFPVSKNGGNGARIRVGSPLAMSSNSQNKNYCYEFMDYMLTDDFQRTLNYRFPVNRKIFQENAEADSKPQTYKDEKGRDVEQPLTVYIHETEKEIPNMPMSFANDLETYILGIRDSSYADPQIMNIITEEANMLYAGDQDAAKAANSIQNRVSLYLQEQK